jgi:leader peptidase (prepilin peptidase) / N-methyltransferase
MIVVAILAGSLGSVIGSFLNVVIFRVPAGRSIVAPPSACGSCGHRIRARDNVPMVSWLLLRGRCRDCAAPISARYPLVEAATAVLFVAVALRFPLTAPSMPLIVSLLAIAAFAYLASVSIALAMIDLDTKTLPNRIVLPAYLVGAALVVTTTMVTGDLGAMARAAMGMLGLGMLYLALSIATGGMGMGDVKLAGVLGLFLGWLGWDTLIVGSIAGFILGGIWGVILLATNRARRGSSVPFGPWMLAGAWTAILFGQWIASSYLSVAGIR